MVGHTKAQLAIDNPHPCCATYVCAQTTCPRFLGHTKAQLAIDNPLFHSREMTVMASRNALYDDFARVIGLIEAGEIDVSAWVTHRCALGAFEGAFKRWKDPEEGVIKGMISLGTHQGEDDRVIKGMMLLCEPCDDEAETKVETPDIDLLSYETAEWDQAAVAGGDPSAMVTKTAAAGAGAGAAAGVAAAAAAAAGAAAGAAVGAVAVAAVGSGGAAKKRKLAAVDAPVPAGPVPEGPVPAGLVVQFGHGVFLRGHIDWMLQRSHDAGSARSKEWRLGGATAGHQHSCRLI